jgi:hypothetical protein
MRCKEARRLISLFVDGELEGDRKKELEEHLSSCHECRVFLSDFQLIRREAEELKSQAPIFALPFKEIGKKSKVFPPFFSLPKLVTAAIALFFFIGSLFLFLYFREKGKQAISPADIATAHFIEAEYHYEKALKLLEGDFRRKEASLDPELRKVIEDNLAIIDQAILACRQAVAKEPGNHELRKALLNSYRKKLTLFERIAFKEVY